MKMRQKIVYSLVFMLIFSATIGAMASSDSFNQQKAEPTGDRDYTHNVLAEFGTATTCVPCKYAHQALKILYNNKEKWNKPFFYVSLVGDVNDHAEFRKNQLGIEVEPSVWWDGGYKLDEGASNLQHALTRYNVSLPASGNRNVVDIDISLDVDWLGAVNPVPADEETGVHQEPTLSWNLTAFNIDIAIDNNDASYYDGRLRVYVVENESTYWLDKFHLPYTKAFLDYAWDQFINISAGDTWEDSMEWDGCDYDNGLEDEDYILFDDIWQDNVMVIASVFKNDTKKYSDDTIGILAGEDTYPKTHDIYFGNTTPPPKVSSNQSGLTYNPPGILDWNTTYYWKVVTWDNQDNKVESPIYEFTVRDNHAPDVPHDPYPPHNDTSTPIKVNLTWISEDPENDTEYYDVYFGKEFPPEKISGNQTDPWYDYGLPLEFYTRYYWKIVAWDRWGFKSIGPNWTFFTQKNLAPRIPSNPTPADGYDKAPVSTNLSWRGGDPNTGEDIYYDIYLEMNDPDPDLFDTIGPFDASQIDITYDPVHDLELFEKYYWKIVTRDSEDLTGESDVWEFETGINEKPVVSINGPVKVTEDELTEFTFTITDAEEDNVSLYVDWGDETNTGWLGPYSDYPIVIKLEHAWPEGKYTISADVKDPYQNGEGDSLQISSPFIRSFDSYIFNLLQRIIQRFPVLKLILSSFPTFYKILEI